MPSNSGKDSTLGTLLRALVICFVCSIVVSVVVVFLRPIQDANKLADKQKSALQAAQIAVTDPAQISDIFSQQMETRIVDLQDAEFADKADLAALGVEVKDYDPLDVVSDSALGYKIDSDKNIARIDNRARYMPVYMITDGDNKGGIVLPVYGKGLWSTLYGYLALAQDGNTIISLKFYDQKETPGLGGRIADDQRWLASWEGKLVYDVGGEPKIALVKGRSPAGSDNAQYEIDSLSGASLTSIGVTNLLKYWMGQDAYGPFMKKFQSGRIALDTNIELFGSSSVDMQIESAVESVNMGEES